MRILHITPDYHPALGGGELHVKEVSERLASRGHEVTVLAMNSRGLRTREGKALPRREVIGGVTVRRLNNSYRLHESLFRIRGAHRAIRLVLGSDRLEMLRISPWSPRAFVATLRSGADVVGVFNWYHGFLAYQTSIARGLGRFAFVGLPLFHVERPWAASPLFAHILNRCDAIAAQTEYEKQFVEQQSGRPIVHVVGPGVEPALFAGADGSRVRTQYGLDGAPVVGYVGRMAASKGVVTVIHAMRIVWRDNPAVRLLLAGTGLPSSPRCEDEVRQAFAALSESERSRVVTIGSFADDQKASLFDALDVFAMPSVAESFGIAYLEAWMCRKAVIGARIPSTECVIRDGVDGMLVEPGVPGDLAKSIALLLEDRAARERMGKAGHEKTLALFTWEKVVDSIENTYATALAQRGAAAGSRRVVA